MQNEIREKIQNEAFEEAMKHDRRSLALSMRLGKTLIGIRIADAHLVNPFARVLVVAPKVSIFDSWKDDIKKFGYLHLEKDIDFCTYVSFNKKDLSKYTLIIFDECHSLKASHQTTGFPHSGLKLMRYSGEILGLTGTPPKSKYSEKYQMMEKYCPIVYEYGTEEAVTAEILNDYRIIVHMIPLSEEKNIHVKTAKWDFWTSEKKSYESYSKKLEEATGKDKQWASLTRMKMLQTFKSKEEYAKKLFDSLEEKSIIFTNTKEQAKKMSEYYYFSGNPTNEVNLSMFKTDVIDKMSCVLQLSEGITIPGLKSCLIMHSYGNESKFLQRFARCLSLSTDEMANIHVLCYEDTQDVNWVKASMEKLDQSKIQYKKFIL